MSCSTDQKDETLQAWNERSFCHISTSKKLNENQTFKHLNKQGFKFNFPQGRGARDGFATQLNRGCVRVVRVEYRGKTWEGENLCMCGGQQRSRSALINSGTIHHDVRTPLPQRHLLLTANNHSHAHRWVDRRISGPQDASLLLRQVPKRKRLNRTQIDTVRLIVDTLSEPWCVSISVMSHDQPTFG